MQNYRERLGENIKKIRDNKKLTQSSVSKLSQIDQSLLSKIENGYPYGINLSLMIKIANALEVELKEILIVKDINIISTALKLSDLDIVYLENIFRKESNK